LGFHCVFLNIWDTCPFAFLLLFIFSLFSFLFVDWGYNLGFNLVAYDELPFIYFTFCCSVLSIFHGISLMFILWVVFESKGLFYEVAVCLFKGGSCWPMKHFLDWIRLVLVSDICHVWHWHDTDYCKYTELCDFFKLLAVSCLVFVSVFVFHSCWCVCFSAVVVVAVLDAVMVVCRLFCCETVLLCRTFGTGLLGFVICRLPNIYTVPCLVWLRC